MTSHESDSDPKKPLTESRRTTRPLYSRRAVVLSGVGAGLAGLGIGAVAGYLAHDPLIKWAAGGNNRYTQLDWQDVQTNEQPAWHSFARDPEAGRRSSEWKILGLIATNSAALDAQRIALGAQHAAAYKISDDEIKVGILPTGQPFFSSIEGEPENYTFGLRVGPGDLLWTPGLWRPGTQEFVAPAAGTVARGTTTVDKIEQTHPGAIYV